MSDVSRGRLLVVSAASAVIVLSFVVPAGAVGVPAAVIAPAGSRPGHPAGPDDRITAGDSRLLPSPARGTRAVESLGSALDVAAARNGYTPDRLAGLLRADTTAWLDRDGRLFYVEPTPSVTAKAAVGAGQAGPASSVATPYPLSDTFALHSKPDSTKTIYLDFTGQRVAGTIWNQNSGLPDGVYEPWSLDSNGNDFNDSERATIQSVWQRVAEDYAAFDVDVTTQDPGSDALTRSSAGDQTYGTRALITPNQVARQAVCGGSCGGVAYVGTFDAIVASPSTSSPRGSSPKGWGRTTTSSWPRRSRTRWATRSGCARRHLDARLLRRPGELGADHGSRVRQADHPVEPRGLRRCQQPPGRLRA